MFRNPVYDMMVVVPALLIAGLLGFLVMTSPARAATIDEATTTGGKAETASSSGTTMPDLSEKIIVVDREQLAIAPTPAFRIASPLVIHSGKELLDYARQVLRDDPYIASITLSGQEIVVTYRKQGLLLGLVPVSLPRTAHVRTDGTVFFTDPWYGPVTLAERDRMKSALEVRVHALLTTEGYFSSMSLAPATQAEILDIIRELLA